MIGTSLPPCFSSSLLLASSRLPSFRFLFLVSASVLVWLLQESVLFAIRTELPRLYDYHDLVRLSPLHLDPPFLPHLPSAPIPLLECPLLYHHPSSTYPNSSCFSLVGCIMLELSFISKYKSRFRFILRVGASHEPMQLRVINPHTR